MTQPLFAQISELVLTLGGAALLIWAIIRRVSQKRQARQQQEHPRPAIYAVGSPEYNAQIVGVIHTLNERLAAEGKRIPEKAAIDIIHQFDQVKGKE